MFLRWQYRQSFRVFFFNDTATTEIYTLSLHDALPISLSVSAPPAGVLASFTTNPVTPPSGGSASSTLTDRKSTRLNSSHGYISYAVFCLKKKKMKWQQRKPDRPTT